MSLLKKKSNPTLADRAQAAETTATAALVTFEMAALDLESAAAASMELVDEANTEADRLRMVASTERARAEVRARQASKIRDLIGVSE